MYILKSSSYGSVIVFAEDNNDVCFLTFISAAIPYYQQLVLEQAPFQQPSHLVHHIFSL